MRKNDRFEQELNVVGAARRAKAFGIKTMTVVVTVAMLVSGVPTRVIAEGLQEAGVIAAQDSTDQSASSSGQQETAQSNTQEQPQAASEQAAQPSSQDNAATAQNNSTSAQPAPSAQPSQQTETADIALTLNNASITYKGQVVAQPAQKVTAPTSDSFEFTVQPDNGYKLSKVTLTVSGADRELKADANGLYTVDAADVAQSPRVTLETEQEKAAEPAKEATPIEDAEGVSDDNAAADQSKGEKDVNAVDVAAPADAKAADKTVEVGGTVPITSNFGGNSDEWTSSDSKTATVSGSGRSAMVTGKKTGTVTITHKYYGWFGSEKTETFTVQVTPAQPKISGADTVKMGESATFTVSGFEQGQTVQWKSENSNVATVDASGNVTGVHVGKTNIIAYTNNQSVSKQIEVKRDDSSGGYYVYLYTKAEGNTDGLALTVNSSGWYTIGRVWVAGIQNPAQARQNGKSQTNDSFNKTIEALNYPDNIDLYGVNSINLSDINWRASGDYGITLASGANDYPEATGTQWHLDGYVKFDYFGSLIFHYKDAKTKDKIAEDYTTTAKVTDENFDFSSLKISIAGYTYDHADPELVKVEKNQTKEVTLYYNKGTFPYTVKYLEKGTGRELRTEKSGAGEYGSTVTENAKDIDGYELADGTQKQQSIQLGTGDNIITFYYKKAPASYTVNYYWNGTTEKVADSKTVETRYVNDEVTESPIDVAGCTPVSVESKKFKLVKDKSKNEINFYYYKNVELTANSKTVPYNGEQQSVSGFTGAPEGADFSEITVGASGTNAGTYPANFAEGTVGKVDKTEKYIVANATNGKLVINPVTKQVVIKVTGHTGGEKYNGKKQTVTGYDVSGLPEGLTKDDIACDGKAEAKGTDAGTYAMGLKASQFSLTSDAAKNFTNVQFNVTDGKLTIAKRKVTLASEDGHKNYDGKTLQRRTNLKVGGDGFVGKDGVLAKDKLTWHDADNILPGTYENKFDPAYTEGTNLNNYEITCEFGELVVNARTEKDKYQVTVTANSDTQTYNGNEHSVSGVSGTIYTNKEGAVFTIEGLSATVSGTDAGEYTNKVTGTAVVKDAQGNDVTSQFKVTTADGKLTINKRDVTIKPKDATKVYNGKKLVATDWEVAEGSFGFVKGQGIANPKYTGSQTKPGSSKSGISSWGYKDNTKADNYNIKTADGTLTVTSRGATQTITVEANSTDAIYDGTEHSAKGLKSATFTVDGETYTVSGLTTDDPVKTDAGTYTNNITGTAKVTDADGNDVTSEFKVETKNGTLKIAQAKVTIAPKDASKPYDGTPLVASDFTATGFVGKDGVTNVVYEGSQTDAGNSKSSIVSYEAAEGTNLDNYNITKGTGALTVTATDAAVVVKIKGNTDSKKYSGNGQSVSGYTVTGVTVDGKDSDLYGAVAEIDFTFSGNATAACTDAGTTDMGLAADQFKNISKNFSNVTFEVEDGSMTITKREVTLTSATDKKPYDGTALTNSEVTVSGDGFVSGQGFTANVTGSQINAGSSDNTFTYELTGGATKGENGNYDITVVPGTLTVNPITDLVTVTIVGNHEYGTYNGRELKAEGYTFTSDNTLYTQDKVTFSGTAEASCTDAGKTVMGLNGKFANADTTNFRNVTFEVTDGYVEIAKASVTLKSANLSKQYDGTALVNGETALETESGFAEGEGATYNFTGAQTVVGFSANAFEYTLNSNTKLENYDITKTEGTLTVTNRDAKYEITVKANSNEATYDGKSHSATGLKQTVFSLEGNEYTVSGLTTENPDKTDAGTYTNNITGTAKVTDVDGNDVTNQFKINPVNGSLVINKAAVTMKSASDEWTYDGNEHTKHEMEFVKGFADGEGATISYTGAITNAGETKNTFTYELNKDTTNPDNYTIADPEYGTLKVKPVSDKVTVTITGNQDTKDYTGTEQSVTGYEFKADNKLYTDGDFKFIGNATAKGTAAGTYTMGLTKENFSNNSENFTNVEFVVDDGWLKITGGQIDQDGVVWKIKDLQKVYDGTSLAAYAATATDKHGNALKVEYSPDEGETWTSDPSKITLTHFGYKKVLLRATGSNYAKGQYATSSENIAITKRLVTLESAGATKPYDGKALTNETVTVTPKGEGVGFVDDEGVTIKVTGSQTEKGESDNTFTFKFKEGTKEEDYWVTPKYGKLIVTADANEVVVTITEHSYECEYDGTEKTASGYDFEASNELYKKDDFSFAGDATAKGTNVGIYNMELKPSDFTNNNQNFSKVTFVIVDGQLNITSKNIETGKGMTVEKPADVPYNGKVQQQKPVVKDGDEVLVEGTDYTLSYSEDATNVGTVKVTVTGMGNYSGSVDVTYQITKRSVVLTSETASKPYDGTPLTKPDVAMTGDGFVEGEVSNIRATGSVTTVAEGEVTNAIEFDTSKTFKPTNYDITKKEGKLSIAELSSENGLTIKPSSVGYPYDATKHAAAAATANASVSGTKVNLEYRVKGTTDDNWTSDSATITAVNAGETVIEVRASAANYSGYKYAEQTLTINMRTVELKSASATKVYDGTPLVNDRVAVSREGFIKSDLVEDVHATGTQTEVGNSNNTISYKFKEGVANNYNILPEKLGTLTVTAQSIVPDPENPDGYKGVTISDPSSSVYNGEVHKWVPEVKDAKGVALTEGTDYTVSYDTDNFIDAKKITVTIAGTGNYCGSVTKTYRITKAPLTVNAKSASKVYDGNELTAGGTIEGLVGDETATAKTEGSQTKVGSSDNKFVGIEWDGTAKENNYYIQSQNDGVLTVTAKGVAALEVGTLADVVYSGVDQAQKPEVKDGDKALKEGTDYKVSFSKDVKNVGTVTVAVTGKGNYNGTVERTYQITPATLTVTTPSKSQVYNGKALTAEGTVSGFVNGETAAFATTGSQTKVGSSTNTYAIDWGAKESTAKKSNYSVSENLGTLTVTESAKEIVATPGSYKGVYDGKAHGVDVTVSGLPEGYTVKSAVSNATATDVTEGKVKAEVDDLVIVNAQGEDVTSKLNITKGVGTIEITPAPLKVTTYGAKAEYNGQALTAGGKVTGFVNNEAASFTTTGSQTEVGNSDNTYKIDWNDTAKESNYTVEKHLGTLEVTKNMVAVMVIPNGGSKVYDGEALESDGVTTYGLPSGYTLEAKTKGSVTNVGSATAEVESYTIKNAAGKDVTDQFGNVAIGKATLEVTKRPVTVTSATDSKVYDGSALTKHEASVTAGSLAKGEIFTYDFTGEQTVVGSTANSFTVKAGENTNLDNYKISKADGTLTVTAKSIVPDPSDEHNKMSVDAPASVKYDGNAHKWIPTVKDGDKTLKEGADYTVSYSNDDFTNVTGVITVTITGKGNYAGTVTRTYEITKRSVKLTGVKNVTKVYDGTALEAKDVTVTGDGFVKDEVADIKATGSVTEVTAKPVENPIEFTAGKGFKEGNYTIEKDPGTLQVTARSIDDATYGMSVNKPESVEYDGQAHKWAPTVKDGEKTLVEGTDYTVAYGKDDFTNVTGEIKVTVAGKGNYAGSVERTYQITPAPLTVETEGATKVYDGEALTHDVATIKGLKNNETATIYATGSQTEVGESDNGYAITWDGSAQKDNYTIKTKTIGKLVVSETADQITATPANVETTYDGSAHGTTVQVTGLPKGYTVKKAESKATATNVADGEVKATVDELVIVNAQGKDVTSKLNIKRGTATIKITPAPLTVTTDGGEKEYDGTALTANGIKVEGLEGKDSVSAKTTGSRTKVGSSNNTYEINWKDTKKSNYKVTDVLGTLKVTPSNKVVTLTSGSASHAYSGHALTSDEIKAEGLPEGFTVKAEMDGAQTDAGSSENTVKSYEILDAKGDDVTGMFANVTVKTGTLTVSPKKITVETEGATKVYDGEELTNENGAIHGLVSGEHADVVTNGTQTNVGSSDNGYTIAWGTAKEGNYTIASDTLGKLVVTPQSVNPNDPSYHKLQVSNPADLTYDGQTHKWAPEVKDFTGTELKEGVDYTLTYDTDDFINAGSITVTVVGKGNYTGTVSRTYRIKPAPVSIKTESAARVYNGKALTAGGAITGLVNGETVDFRVIGSQTKVGHSANTYKLAWTGTAREANYTVDSIETGTLTVTESEDTVVVTTTGGTFTYDGKAHGATVAVSQLPEGYTVDGTPSSDATATDANGDGVKATVDHLVIRNAEGEDVTSKLNIKKVDGTIKVLPAELTVTTDSATKVYDGTALTAGATVTGLVGDEEATFEATGKQTQVGSSSNGYKLTFDKTAKDKNYKVVSENLGTLTVTKQSIVPSEPGTPSDNYKGVTVDDPKDAVYDGVEHKWTPVVKDAEGKTLVEGTDYVVSYDIDEFIDVATINVTITGKGNYAGTIAKSYRITKAPLHVVTGSATKVFDGQALTSATVTIDGLAKRDRIGVAVTGSQTNVGSSQNTYAIDWMQTSADNYELTDELGTLTVAAAPARPTTPTTPSTPTTPTVPNPTPSSSDGGSTTTTTAPKGDDSSASNDQEQKEEKIFDAKNPLGKFDGKKGTCWVHWYMIVCAVATAAYGLFVGLRRDKHGRRLQNDLDKVLGDDETQE